MKAYHSDPAVKRRYLRRVAAHRRFDQLVQGTGWEQEQNRGCAVGCTLHAYDHERYPVELGVPVELAYLEDAIFEGLPAAAAQRWPERFLREIRVGVDLVPVWPRFVLWLLREELAPHYAASGRTAAERVCALYERRLTGDEPPLEEWLAARAEAKAAAEAARAEAVRAAAAAATATEAEAARAAQAAAAAEAEAWEAVVRAAWEAARAEARAAWEAAWAAARAAAEGARAEARAEAEGAYGRMADKLIELLKGAR